jgi:hypothetical protein
MHSQKNINFLHGFLYGYQFCPCVQNTYTHVKHVTSIAVDDSYVHPQAWNNIRNSTRSLWRTVSAVDQWQTEHHTRTEMQMHRAVSGVLCVYFVTLSQPTPDRLQYSMWVSEGLNSYMTAAKDIPTDLMRRLQQFIKWRSLQTIFQNKHQLECGVGWHCWVICDVVWMHHTNCILHYPCLLTFHVSSPFQSSRHSEPYCNSNTVILYNCQSLVIIATVFTSTLTKMFGHLTIDPHSFPTLLLLQLLTPLQLLLQLLTLLQLLLVLHTAIKTKGSTIQPVWHFSFYYCRSEAAVTVNRQQ